MKTYGLLMSVYFRDCPIHLAEALSSCDFSELCEVVIVSDGPVSEEHIACIKRIVPDEILKLVHLDKNMGLGVALNRGLKECAADYIFRMDSDDVCVPERFSKQIEFLNINDCDILGGQIHEFEFIPEVALAKRTVPIGSNSIAKALLRRNAMNHVTVCYKRCKIIEIGSYHNILYHEDYDLWIRAVTHDLTMVNLDQILVQVRTGNGFLSRRHGLAYLATEWRFVFKNLRFFRLHALEYLIIRSLLRLGPQFILNFVYARFLRKR